MRSSRRPRPSPPPMPLTAAAAIFSLLLTTTWGRGFASRQSQRPSVAAPANRSARRPAAGQCEAGGGRAGRPRGVLGRGAAVRRGRGAGLRSGARCRSATVSGAGGRGAPRGRGAPGGWGIGPWAGGVAALGGAARWRGRCRPTLGSGHRTAAGQRGDPRAGRAHPSLGRAPALLGEGYGDSLRSRREGTSRDGAPGQPRNRGDAGWGGTWGRTGDVFGAKSARCTRGCAQGSGAFRGGGGDAKAVPGGGTGHPRGGTREGTGSLGLGGQRGLVAGSDTRTHAPW